MKATRFTRSRLLERRVGHLTVKLCAMFGAHPTITLFHKILRPDLRPHRRPSRVSHRTIFFTKACHQLCFGFGGLTIIVGMTRGSFSFGFLCHACFTLLALFCFACELHPCTLKFGLISRGLLMY